MTIDTARCDYTGCGGTAIKRAEDGSQKLIGDPCEGCPDCTEPAPSAEELTKYGQNSVQFYEVPPVDRAIAELRSRIAELESNKRALQSVYAVAVEDQEIKAKRIAELEAGIPKFDPVVLSMLYTAADEVKPTHRGAVLRAYEYIRALLPKASDAQGKRDE